MGGAHEALRHMLPNVRNRPFARSKLSRALTGDVPENPSKGSKTVPAGSERDLCNGQLGVAKQRCGSLHTAREQVAVWRQAEGLLELAREVRDRDRAHLCQPVDGPLLMGRAIHPIFRTQQSPQ